MDISDKFEKEDIKNNRIFAVLSYIPLLFIVPILFRRTSKFVRFSLNQGIPLSLLLIVAFFSQLLFRFIFVAPMFTGVLVVINVVYAFFYILIATFLVDGIISSTKERAKVLPIVRKFELFKF